MTSARHIQLSAPSRAKGFAVILLSLAVLIGAWGLVSSARSADAQILAAQREQRCRADAAVDANQAQARVQIVLAQLVFSVVQRDGQARSLAQLLGQNANQYQAAVDKQEAALTRCRKS